MIPLPMDEGFEGFEALTERTNSWLKEQPMGTVLINMQSVLIQKQEGTNRFWCLFATRDVQLRVDTVPRMVLAIFFFNIILLSVDCLFTLCRV